MRLRGTGRFAAVAALLVAGIALSGCAAQFAAAEDAPRGEIEQPDRRVIEFDGAERSYVAHIPDGAAIGAPLTLPVLVVLHGAGGNATKAELATGLSDYAQSDEFIVVYPSGTQVADVPGQLGWNADGCCGAPAATGVDDVGFIAAVLDDIESEYAVDTERIYVAGFSNGGMMTYRLSCELGDRIAGIAVVAGAFNVAECDSDAHTDVLIVHGTDDQTVPYRGGPTNERTAARFGQWMNSSVGDATRTWMSRNDCDSRPVTNVDGSVTRETYEGCDDGSRLTVVTLSGGAHVWPMAPVSGFDASASLVEYFRLDS
jgi:polyhydroxybutyrate depolymerase